jgi:hypothetical protein
VPPKGRISPFEPQETDMKTNEEYRLLEQQLKELTKVLGDKGDNIFALQKQIVMLRELLNTVQERGDLYTSDLYAVRKALSATQDLKDCIICDAKPAGTFLGCVEEGKAFQATHPNAYPLFQARKP